MQFALRYEDYGSDVGSTVDPKIGVALAGARLAGTARLGQTTFRGPPQSYLSGRCTALVFIAPTPAFKAVNIVGNPD